MPPFEEFCATAAATVVAYLPYLAYAFAASASCTFLLPCLYRMFLYPQDLKKKYGAEWVRLWNWMMTEEEANYNISNIHKLPISY